METTKDGKVQLLDEVTTKEEALTAIGLTEREYKMCLDNKESKHSEDMINYLKSSTGIRDPQEEELNKIMKTFKE